MSRRDLLLAYRRGELDAPELRAQLALAGSTARSARRPLSEGQKGLWVLHKMSPEDEAYNVPVCLRIAGPLDPVALELACRHVLQKHSELAVAIEEDEQGPLRRARATPAPLLRREDISGLTDAASIGHVAQCVRTPFVLREGSLTRFHLFSRADDEHLLLIVIHHAVFDGYSGLTLEKDLFGAYRSLVRNEPVLSAEMDTTYDDFVAWERLFLESAAADSHRTFWSQQLTSSSAGRQIPQRQGGATVAGSGYGRVLTRELSEGLTGRIAAFCHLAQMRPTALFLGIFQLCLGRWSRLSDVTVGVPTRGRPEARFASVVGYFVNVVPVHARLDALRPFGAWVRSVQLALVDALDHAAYPYPRIVRELAIPHSPLAPLLQCAFEYLGPDLLESPWLADLGDCGLRISRVAEIQQTTPYPLTMQVRERGVSLSLHIKYDARRFEDATAQRLLDGCVALLDAAMTDPQRPLEDLCGCIDSDTLPELVAAQIARTPEAIAIAHEESTLTYRELGERAHDLASRLRALGVGPEVLVGVFLERSAGLLPVLVGVHRAGGAYLPIDPHDPQDRVEYILRDSGAAVVVTQRAFEARLGGFPGVILIVDAEGRAALDSAPPVSRSDLPAPSADNLAYVIYTSGSTGRPKGCAVSHAAICNRLMWMQHQYGLRNDDRVLQKTPLTFDVSLWELFWPLIVGARVVLAHPQGYRDARYLAHLIRGAGITMCHFVPTMLQLFLEGVAAGSCATLRDVFCSGEALPPGLVKAFKSKSQARLHNLYGPTEAAVDVSYWECADRPDGKVPIGMPISNTHLYVLDADLNPLPVGERGELFIGGAGLARGYSGRPGLTAERFVADPFGHGARLYKTGDLASSLPDGNLEYHGRSDSQVKLHGYRIELTEIECALLGHPAVASAAALLEETEGSQQIVAYYVLAAGVGQPAVRSLRDHLRTCLPDYMVPAQFILLDKLPLTGSGKLDRAGLRAPAVAAVAAPRQEPAETGLAALESRLLALWRSVLKVAEVGPQDGFFECGGDSLLAVVLAQRISDELQVDFDVMTLLRYANVRNISRHLLETASASKQLESASEPGPGDRRGTLPDYYAQSVAVIGISCCFPGARDHRQLWMNLRNAVESVERVPNDELRALGMPERILRDPAFVPACGRIDRRDWFDAGFFKISERDAQLMDPQLRLLLENAWRAIEDSGYRMRDVADTAVIMSASCAGPGLDTTQADGTSADSSERYVSWTLAQGGSIPTQVSHKLGLQGPSLFVHSNCSSSLAALDCAYRCLLRNESRYALVGAASLLPSWGMGYIHQEGMNFSSDGHLRAFDAAADGLVPGEGVAVLLLKRARDAVTDGDHIYALLRGTAVNNDGADKAGFYAPSVEGQARVITKALTETAVEPDTIGYVEAHGTGTTLGDPIEFEALREVYGARTTRRGFCGLGSVKSNIGHLDAAAGMAGCVKAVLSLANGEIPPTLHYSAPNPRLRLESSPFYVVNTLTPWPAGAHVRRAAVSSFGIGGTNTHAIFEDYNRTESDDGDPGVCLVPLSARSDDCLNAYASHLLEFIQGAVRTSLRNLAYTLQLGREAMPRRAIFAARSIAELREALEAFVFGRGAAHRQPLPQVALDWEKGLEVDWSQQWPDGRGRRISLPTYPFIGKQYPPRRAQERQCAAGELHPLLHTNTSDLDGVSFNTTLTGAELFLRDHIVDGVRVLPGVACLEMAWAAIERAGGEAVGGPSSCLTLEHVTWLRPIVATDGPVTLRFVLKRTDAGTMTYCIDSGKDSAAEVGGSAQAVYCEGSACVRAYSVPTVIDLQAWRTKCNGPGMSAEECYAVFAARGYHYGPAQRAIVELFSGSADDGTSFVLARLELPAFLAETAERYVLHPSLLDSALQASVGLRDIPSEAALPFALDRMIVHGAVPRVAWVRVLRSRASTATLYKLDFDISDEKGRICVELQGFCTRPRKIAPAESPAEHLGLTTCVPVWEPAQYNPVDPWPSTAHVVLIIGGTTGQQRELLHRYPRARTLPAFSGDESVEQITGILEASGALDHIMWIAPEEPTFDAADERLIACQERGVICCFRLIKALLGWGYESRPLQLTFVTTQAQAVLSTSAVNPVHAAVHGLVGSLAKEQPYWRIRLVDLQAGTDWPLIELLSLPADPEGNTWAYRNNQWYRQELVPWQRPTGGKALYRQGGVYVVVGGAGGIGQAWSEYVIREYQAHVVWIGRSGLSERIERAMARLGAVGPKPSYLQADAASPDSLRDAYRRIRQQHPAVHGLVHSAIVLADKSLLNMSEQQLRLALRAKIDASVRLAGMLDPRGLDFVLFFSAIQTFGRARGQGNYAAGCVFKDAFAQLLATQWPCPVKVMNWGYWGSVGIVSGDEYRTRMARLGVGSIEPEAGMEALETLLSGPFRQLAVHNAATPHAWDALNLNARESIVCLQDASPQHARDADAEVPARTLLPEDIDAVWTVSPQEFDDLLCRLLHCQLRSVPESHLHARWSGESRRILEQHGYGIGQPVSLDAHSVWQEWARWTAGLSDATQIGQARLVETTLRALPQILTGRVAATQIIFPQASTELVEPLYRDCRLATYFNEVLGDALLAHIERIVRDVPNARVRILEVGAGTGSTSTVLLRRLAALRDHIEEYCYTDISRAFLNHGEENHAPGVPWLTFRPFDIEKPAAEQGIVPGSYDFLIGANVLHATRNIRRTLRNVKAALRAGGVLLLSEMSSNPLYAHLTFGLLEGWWLHEDTVIRIPGSPGLAPGTWRAVLEEEGFLGVRFPASTAHQHGHQIIVARSDGLIRQRMVAARSTGAPTPQRRSAPIISTDTPPAEGVLEFIRDRVARTLRIAPREIDVHETLEQHGIDSIIAVQLANALRERFRNVRSTAFFEYPTIASLAQHLAGSNEVATPTAVSGASSTPSPSKASPCNEEPVPRARIGFEARDRDIAIVGISGRYPDAPSLAQFWENLCNSHDSVKEIPAERWPLEGFFTADPIDAVAQCKSYCKWGAFLDGYCEFDPLFFNLSPREAIDMDPQERLFLEVCWEAFEDAGYTKELLDRRHGRRVGVFVGMSKTGFELHGPPAWAHGERFHPHTSFASVANRVSYLMNLRGPSLPIDTMCSASLTAIHEACEHLLRDECEMAVAGGVNLYLHPATYVALCEQRVLSVDGRCKAFGAQGNGIVPGEGVGAVVLKRFSRAFADGDHIHAVIRGTSINHGGKTHGYTVPSSEAQAELVLLALDRAGIQSRVVSYLEAHGTGTELGDPIEIAGLTRAFRRDTADTGFCTIGSVKTNIGHLEAAAGIAGLTKVLLQMRHRRLVPSLHAGVLNPHIDFAETPFVVGRQSQEWQRAEIHIDGVRRERPRIAGISSFGAGGSNAHVIVEEYVQEVSAGGIETSGLSPGESALVVLSAQTVGQLREYGARLAKALAVDFAECDLQRIAYTLQTGRQALAKRLAIVCGSLKELREKLQAFLSNQDVPGIYHGPAPASSTGPATLPDRWLSSRDSASVAKMWVQGGAVDWQLLYPRGIPRRISLPTYPFAAERYWIPQASQAALRQGANRHEEGSRHPLLQRNTSDLTEQRFTSVLDGTGIFIRDHVVNGAPVLAAAVYLEIAYAAVRESLPEPQKIAPITLRQFSWIKPLMVSEKPQRVHVALARGMSNELAVEIYSETGSGQRTTHARAVATLDAAVRTKTWNLGELLQRCRSDSIVSSECYNLLRSRGMDYGAAYRGLHTVRTGTDTEDQPFVLARLVLPAAATDSYEQYLLHPGLVDAALQSASWLAETGQARGNGTAAIPMSVPFLLDRLEVSGRCPRNAWAVTRLSRNSTPALPRIDVAICDDDGRVHVSMEALCGRAPALPAQCKVSLLASFEEPLPASELASAKGDESWIILADMLERGAVAQELTRQFAAALPATRCVVLSEAGDIAARFEKYVSELLEIVRQILLGKPRVPVSIQLVVPCEGDGALSAALFGVLCSAQSENPLLVPQMIRMPSTGRPEELLSRLREIPAAVSRRVLYCADDEIRVRRLREIQPVPAAKLPWKPAGVYLITGGLGALGLIFAQEAAARERDVVLVLVGRADLDARGRGELESLRARCRWVEYYRADVASRAAVGELIAHVETRFGRVDGIIHCAGLVRDSFILTRKGAQSATALSAKVSGTCNLDLATRHLSLDFFVLFSSAAAVWGPVGQADYAAANGFMDHFAQRRNALVARGERAGRTVSIGWCLWAEGGMKLDAASSDRMQQLGLQPLSTEAGIDTFYRALGAGQAHVLVVSGKPEEIATMISNYTGTGQLAAASLPAIASEGTEEGLRARTDQYFRRRLAAALKLPIERIEAHAPLENYGIESVLALQLTGELERVFGSLPKTLFFEYRSIEALVDYFMECHRSALVRSPEIGTIAAAGESDIPRTLGQPSSPERAAIWPVDTEAEGAAQGDVAIVGLAGTYPQANTLEAFWENLAAGRDCIEEIPPGRWSLESFFDPQKGKSGRSYSKWGGFIEGVADFDAAFFNISPREAVLMDPQERLFLMCAYELLEDAGYTRASLPRLEAAGGANVGVFVGVMYEEYQLYAAQGQLTGGPTVLGGSPASIANRVSYFMDFQGPSLAVDTMCSGSLTAVHLACQSIRQGDCAMAIAGGVNVSIHPNKYLALSQGAFASSTGRCGAFGKGGDGYVPAEGVGAVLLRPLSQALRAGDRIYGVIKATSVNHGGRTNGYTVPSPVAQAQVIARALRRAAIDPRSITYLEAHGTGTSLGDPIEIAGLAKAFGQFTQDKQFCAIGSVKSNIGHCEGAAGIAGITKVLLQMQHRKLVPSLHTEELNPYIEFAQTPFKVQQDLTDWELPRTANGANGALGSRIAGVSSFGAGGANAHVVLQEWPAGEPPAAAHERSGMSRSVIVLSAMSEDSLRVRVQQLLHAVAAMESERELPNIAHTLQVGREEMEFRLALTAASLVELQDKLTCFVAGAAGGGRYFHGRAKPQPGTSRAGAARTPDTDDYSVLLQYWVDGGVLDWGRLSPGSIGRRIRLPTYPFLRKRYWAAESPATLPKVTLPNPEVTSRVKLIQPAQAGHDRGIPVEPTAADREKRVLAAPSRPSLLGDTVIDVLVTTLADALYMDRGEVDIDKPFVDLGLDSVVGVEWVHAVNRSLGTALAATRLYQYPTVRSLGELLLQESAPAVVMPRAPLDEVLSKVYDGELSPEDAAEFLRAAEAN